MSGKKIKRIDDYTFKGLLNLESLDISANRNLEIGSNIFQGLINLQHLKMNSIRTTSGQIRSNTFQDLKNLKSLDLSLNRLSHFPPYAFQGSFLIFFIFVSYTMIFLFS